jgi:DNA-binding NarL/FixJ family response regulator
MTTRGVTAQGTAAPIVRVDGVRRRGGLALVGAFDAARPNGTAAGVAPIGLVIADGQPLARAGFHALLDREADLAVLGEAGDAEQAVALARRTRPAVLLMDIALPGLDGVLAMRRIAADPGLAGVRIVILTACEADEHVFGALRAGVSGFLLKDTGPAELIAAIRDVASGEGALSPSVARRLIDEFATLAERKHPRPERLNELTPRELEVVALVAAGLSNREIAERLVVSPATAKTHVIRALCKLDARDRAQLVTLAYESGLVVPRHPTYSDPTPKE